MLNLRCLSNLRIRIMLKSAFALEALWRQGEINSFHVSPFQYSIAAELVRGIGISGLNK